MTRRENEHDAEARARCEALGVSPLAWPLGEDHHCDVPFSEEDRRVGQALAYFLGTLFSDVDGEGSPYWYHERTSRDEWSRVARALRIHGLKISNANDAS